MLLSSLYVINALAEFLPVGGVAVGHGLPEHMPVSALQTVQKSRDGSGQPGFHLPQSGLHAGISVRETGSE